ncbi:MAG: hypothetical protein R3231_00935 [bacterium]|nr:hypothetical protein [bacterium]
MSGKGDYTPEEWQLLIDIPTMVGAAVMVIGKSGLGSLKESFAMAQGTLSAVEGYPDNELVQALIQGRLKEGAKSTLESLRHPYKGVDREAFKEIVVEKCREAAELLKRKSTEDEARGYKEWALSIGEKVAQAAREGGFLGFGGEQVSQEEKTALREISTALGVAA